MSRFLSTRKYQLLLLASLTLLLGYPYFNHSALEGLLLDLIIDLVLLTALLSVTAHKSSRLIGVAFLAPSSLERGGPWAHGTPGRASSAWYPLCSSSGT